LIYSAGTSVQLQMVINILNDQRLVTDFTAAIHIISIVAAEGAFYVYSVFWPEIYVFLKVF
jgi:hypothetical protein